MILAGTSEVSGTVKTNSSAFNRNTFIKGMSANYEVTNFGHDAYITYSVEIQSKEVIRSVEQMSELLIDEYLKSKGISITIDELIKQVVPEELL